MDKQKLHDEIIENLKDAENVVVFIGKKNNMRAVLGHYTPEFLEEAITKLIEIDELQTGNSSEQVECDCPACQAERGVFKTVENLSADNLASDQAVENSANLILNMVPLEQIRSRKTIAETVETLLQDFKVWYDKGKYSETEKAGFANFYDRLKANLTAKVQALK